MRHIALLLCLTLVMGCATAGALLGVGLTPSERLALFEADIESVSTVFKIYDKSPNAEKFEKFKKVYDAFKPSIEARFKILEERRAELTAYEQTSMDELSASFESMGNTAHVAIE